jgi:hypothetical protein
MARTIRLPDGPNFFLFVCRGYDDALRWKIGETDFIPCDTLQKKWEADVHVDWKRFLDFYLYRR